MTARELITSAMRLSGILAQGEVPSSNEANDALSSLNDMIDTWSNEQLLIPAKAYETFPLVVGQQTYLMGSGASDFNTTRPQFIEDINFQQVSSNPPYELPIKILNQNQWASITTKTLTSNFPTKMWPQYTYPHATLRFWPIPNISVNVVIWSWKTLSTLTTLDTALSVPPGYNKALRYNLAVELGPEYGKSLDPIIIAHATESKAVLKRMNSRVDLLGVDSGLLQQKSSFNWYTGE